MLDHVTIGVTDLARSRGFYDAALAPLGIAYMCGEGDTFGLRYAPQTGVHIAFAAADRATVDRFHAAALAAGGTDHGAPGLRPHYHADYYCAFVLDPDGHNIEAVCHLPPAG
jgi:catechol 2,3-dioxygenase-like lactoylglutathione lyase family enzyme